MSLSMANNSNMPIGDWMVINGMRVTLNMAVNDAGGLDNSLTDCMRLSADWTINTNNIHVVDNKADENHEPVIIRGWTLFRAEKRYRSHIAPPAITGDPAAAVVNAQPTVPVNNPPPVNIGNIPTVAKSKQLPTVTPPVQSPNTDATSSTPEVNTASPNPMKGGLDPMIPGQDMDLPELDLVIPGDGTVNPALLWLR